MTTKRPANARMPVKTAAAPAKAKAAAKVKPASQAKRIAKPVRRPQAQRSAETQSKLIAAAISCLHHYGYSATTVTMVADEAQVSRGAMSHQYPAKTDLMLAVVQAVFEQDAEYYEHLVATQEPLEWMPDLPSNMWNVISKPSGTAVMEIMLASRSDPDLADKLRAMQREIDVRAHEWIVARMNEAGFSDRPNGEAIHRLFVAAVRGLSLEALFRRDRADVENSVAVLKEILLLLYPALATKITKKSKRT